MMPAKILVDTSAWVAFLKPGESPVDTQIKALIDQESIVITDVIIAEITYGARDHHQLKKYIQKFSAIPLVNFDPRTLKLFCEFRFKLKSKGVVTSFTDALIAWIAICNNLMLFTLDKDFMHIAKHSTLGLLQRSS